MLKYVVAFCVISSCASYPDPRIGTYRELQFVQTYPLTSVFHHYILYGDVDIKSEKVVQFLKDHQTIFEAQTWVIEKLVGYDEDNLLLFKCIDHLGNKLILNQSLLTDDLKQELKAKWPSIRPNKNDTEYWTEMYNVFGSCINENAVDFFKETLRLSREYDIGAILSKANINPYHRYEFEYIRAHVTAAIGKRVYIDCLASSESGRQRLMEIRICFNKAHKLADCLGRQEEPYIHYCYTNRTVYYPHEVPSGFY